MAKKSKIARNEQRKVIVERYAAKRLELKKALVDPTAPTSSVRPPASACRSVPATLRRSACAAVTPSTAVPAENLSKFGISRVRFRDMAHRGELPGIPSQAGKFRTLLGEWGPGDAV